jgi:hypothetical protein
MAVCVGRYRMGKSEILIALLCVLVDIYEACYE